MTKRSPRLRFWATLANSSLTRTHACQASPGCGLGAHPTCVKGQALLGDDNSAITTPTCLRLAANTSTRPRSASARTGCRCRCCCCCSCCRSCCRRCCCCRCCRCCGGCGGCGGDSSAATTAAWSSPVARANARWPAVLVRASDEPQAATGFCGATATSSVASSEATRPCCGTPAPFDHPITRSPDHPITRSCLSRPRPPQTHLVRRVGVASSSAMRPLSSCLRLDRPIMSRPTAQLPPPATKRTLSAWKPGGRPHACMAGLAWRFAHARRHGEDVPPSAASTHGRRGGVRAASWCKSRISAREAKARR